MRATAPNIKPLPIEIVGSTKFGRYPKISVEQTFNMIISDGWLVPYAGYQSVGIIEEIGRGRGIFNSTRYNHLIVVIDSGVYIIDPFLLVTQIGTLDTYSGDVFIDENDTHQIAICDKKNIYIFDYIASTFQKAVTGFTPGYVAFQDGYFIASDLNNPQWRLSAPGTGLSWPAGSGNVGTFQTKPDNVVACVRLPGRGNHLLVMGKTVTELWSDVGAQLFPYQRASGFNIDYGCLNASTIATSDTFVVWLGSNEKSGPVIMYSSGGDIQQISNDGINFRFAELQHPENAYGFLFKQDGHLFYQLTFELDDLTLLYDFNTQKFFTLCEEDKNYHIAKRIAFFNNNYYFVSFIDGNLYEMSSNFTTNDGREIPRIRITPTLRLPDSSPFIVNNLTFTMEQGIPSTAGYSDNPRIDLSISDDGGVTFGNNLGLQMNQIAYRKNRVIEWNLGYTNEFTAQLRFWGLGRFVINDGTIGVYQ